MEKIKDNSLAIIALAAIIFALSFAYAQRLSATEHNRQIILRCVEKETAGTANFDGCITLWKPFLSSLGPQELGSY